MYTRPLRICRPVRAVAARTKCVRADFQSFLLSFISLLRRRHILLASLASIGAAERRWEKTEKTSCCRCCRGHSSDYFFVNGPSRKLRLSMGSRAGIKCSPESPSRPYRGSGRERREKSKCSGGSLAGGRFRRFKFRFLTHNGNIITTQKAAEEAKFAFCRVNCVFCVLIDVQPKSGRTRRMRKIRTKIATLVDPRFSGQKRP